MRVIIVFSLITCLCLKAYTQVVQGTVFSEEEAVPFASVFIKGTKFGVYTDEQGKFSFKGVKPGEYLLVASIMGYESFEKELVISEEDSLVEVHIILKEVTTKLNPVVVTGTRTNRRKLDSAIPVNIIDSDVFDKTQAACLADGLAYSSGVRVESNCQTCNYTQVRMNGMGGAYSQILINSRPVFSALNGLYGLEQIPANLINRVEIVRGGGSVLYGSSAIAGTINILTKDPEENSFSLSVNDAVTAYKEMSNDNLINANLSVINEKKSAGATAYASNRWRQEWDANNDGFSELPRLKNTSFGVSSFFKGTENSVLRVNINSINEVRDGGDMLDLPPHERLQSEQRITHILSGTFDYDQKLPGLKSNLSVYGGAQNTRRSHYTGTVGPEGYGFTRNHTYQAGVQLNYLPEKVFKQNNILTIGSDFQYDYLFDEIKSYNYLVNQQTKQLGIFFQSDWNFYKKWTLLTGVRYNYHNFLEEAVWVPRASLLFKASDKVQLRGAYGTGFRAPQAFDADLHMSFAGGGISLIRIDPELEPEFSDSFTASVDYNNATEHYIYGVSLTGFYNKLYNTFIFEEQSTDSDNITLFKTNGEESRIKGVSLDARFNYDYKLEGDFSITFQKSRFSSPVEWSADIPGTETFLRTPDVYGYFTLTERFTKNMPVNLSLVYTGPMFVPHFAGAPGVESDELVKTPSFWDVNIKIERRFALKTLGVELRTFAGVQNVFNQIQKDFDVGPNRDSDYIYGTRRPRTVFAGLRLSSL